LICSTKTDTLSRLGAGSGRQYHKRCRGSVKQLRHARQSNGAIRPAELAVLVSTTNNSAYRDSKLWLLVAWDVEPKLAVLVMTSNNSAVRLYAEAHAVATNRKVTGSRPDE
jgi:hypothetical protein